MQVADGVWQCETARRPAAVEAKNYYIRLKRLKDTSKNVRWTIFGPCCTLLSPPSYHFHFFEVTLKHSEINELYSINRPYVTEVSYVQEPSAESQTWNMQRSDQEKISRSPDHSTK